MATAAASKPQAASSGGGCAPENMSMAQRKEALERALNPSQPAQTAPKPAPVSPRAKTMQTIPEDNMTMKQRVAQIEAIAK